MRGLEREKKEREGGYLRKYLQAYKYRIERESVRLKRILEPLVHFEYIVKPCTILQISTTTKTPSMTTT